MIPFLGAGANLCDRGDEAWGWAPVPAERHGARASTSPSAASIPDPDDLDLLRVSQYVDAARGEDELYLYLREVFDADYPPTSLHRLLARVARRSARTRPAAARP